MGLRTFFRKSVENRRYITNSFVYVHTLQPQLLIAFFALFVRYEEFCLPYSPTILHHVKYIESIARAADAIIYVNEASFKQIYTKYIKDINGEIKLSKLLLLCDKEYIQKETENIIINIPELFVD